MTRKVLFDHIYKAAGSSVDRVLVDHYGQDNVTFGLIEPLSHALARNAGKAVITGHFSFAPGQKLPADRHVLTLLRDPVERVLSHYYFSRNHVPKRGGNPAVELAKVHSLDDYVSCDVPEVQSLLRDDQTVHFLPLRWDGARKLSPEDKLAAAKRALELYDLVGAYEEFDDFVQVLACDLGIPPVAEVPRVNVTNGRVAASEIDAGVRKRLMQMNELDIELYQHALSLFRGKRRDVLRRFAQRAASGDTHDEPVKPATLEERQAPAEVARGAAADFGNRRIEFVNAAVIGSVSRDYRVFTGEVVSVQLIVRAHDPAADVIVGIQVIEGNSRIVFGSNCSTLGKLLEIRTPGEYLVEFRFRCDIGYGDYSITASLRSAAHGAGEFYHWRDQIAWLNVIGNVGDHWEGATKLYPQVMCKPVHADASSSVALVDVTAGRDTSQHLSDHAPLLIDFRGTVEPHAGLSSLRANEVRAVETTVRNEGMQTWPSTGLQRVCVSYRWLDKDRRMLVYDGERTELPRDVEPGESVRVWMVVKALPDRGTFTLSLTLVQEYYAWFDEMGTLPVDITVSIEASVPEAPVLEDEPPEGDIRSRASWLRYVGQSTMGIRQRAWQEYELDNASGCEVERSMLSPSELAVLFMLSKDYYTGEGEIVDLGPLLGVGTNALARGLARNPRVANKDRRIHCFDLFLAEGMGSVITHTSRSGSVFDRFLRNNVDFIRHLSITPGNLLYTTWDRSPVEILFVDVAKSWELNTHVVRHFFSRLIPGRSILAQQDYVHFAEYWIAITMERFAEYFEHLYFVPGSTSVYRCAKEIPNELLYADLGELPLSQKIHYLERARGMALPSVREILKCGQAFCLIENDRLDEAHALLATVEIVAPASDPTEDFAGLIASSFWAVNQALQKAGGRSAAPDVGPLAAMSCGAEGYKADLTVEMGRTSVSSKDMMKGRVRIKNTGEATWLLGSAPIGVVNLGAHLIDAASGKIVMHDYLRRRVGPGTLASVPSGEEVEFEIDFPAPSYGRHILEFDLVAEGLCWFEQNGSRTVRIPVTVT